MEDDGVINSKLVRLKKIRSFLKHQSYPQSISEIHDALIRRLGVDVSRKTIERDVLEMEEDRKLKPWPGNPTKYSLLGQPEIEIPLTTDEIQILLKLLGPDSQLSDKLKEYLSKEN